MFLGCFNVLDLNFLDFPPLDFLLGPQNWIHGVWDFPPPHILWNFFLDLGYKNGRRIDWMVRAGKTDRVERDGQS